MGRKVGEERSRQGDKRMEKKQEGKEGKLLERRRKGCCGRKRRGEKVEEKEREEKRNKERRIMS